MLSTLLDTRSCTVFSLRTLFYSQLLLFLLIIVGKCCTRRDIAHPRLATWQLLLGTDNWSVKAYRRIAVRNEGARFDLRPPVALLVSVRLWTEFRRIFRWRGLSTLQRTVVVVTIIRFASRWLLIMPLQIEKFVITIERWRKSLVLGLKQCSWRHLC